MLKDRLSQAVVQQEAAVFLLDHYFSYRLSSTFKQRTGARGSFLFSGPSFSGRKTTALALTRALFSEAHPFYLAHAAPHYERLLDVPFLTGVNGQAFCSIFAAVTHAPQAVFLLDEAHLLQNKILYELSFILNTGYFVDSAGLTYDFRQAIFIVTTSIGSERFGKAQPALTADTEHATYLTRLLTQEYYSAHDHRYFEIEKKARDSAMPALLNVFPKALCTTLKIIPFFALNEAGIEQIISNRLRALDQAIHEEHRVHLRFSPTVSRYLLQQMLAYHVFDEAHTHPDSIFDEVYVALERALLVKSTEDSKASKQLFLQLAENRPGLTCAWLAEAAV